MIDITEVVSKKRGLLQVEHTEDSDEDVQVNSTNRSKLHIITLEMRTCDENQLVRPVDICTYDTDSKLNSASFHVLDVSVKSVFRVTCISLNDHAKMSGPTLISINDDDSHIYVGLLNEGILQVSKHAAQVSIEHNQLT